MKIPYYQPNYLRAFNQRKAEKLLSQVFERGAEGVEPFTVNQQKTVVDGWDFSDGDGRVLRVVPLQIKLQSR